MTGVKREMKDMKEQSIERDVRVEHGGKTKRNNDINILKNAKVSE